MTRRIEAPLPEPQQQVQIKKILNNVAVTFCGLLEEKRKDGENIPQNNEIYYRWGDTGINIDWKDEDVTRGIEAFLVSRFGTHLTFPPPSEPHALIIAARASRQKTNQEGNQLHLSRTEILDRLDLPFNEADLKKSLSCVFQIVSVWTNDQLKNTSVVVKPKEDEDRITQMPTKEELEDFLRKTEGKKANYGGEIIFNGETGRFERMPKS